MTRMLAVLAILLALAVPAQSQIIAQRTQLASITTSGSDCTTATACAVLSDVFRTSGIGIQLAGTWTGTAQFEGTMDGTNWTAMTVTPLGGGSTVTSSTGNGVWVVMPAVLQGVRVRASALATPPITVSILAR